MKNILFCTLPLFALAIFSGCETMYNTPGRRQEADTAAMRAAMERQQLSRDTEIAKATAQSAEMQLQQLDMRLSQLENGVRQSQNESSADLAALQREIASLKGETAAIRAERETMKKEIINQISSELAKLLATQQKAIATTARTEVASQSGYEHKVQPGQTLSAIAQAYGVTVEKIKKANSLKSDVIRVNQTLFIPD